MPDLSRLASGGRLGDLLPTSSIRLSGMQRRNPVGEANRFYGADRQVGTFSVSFRSAIPLSFDLSAE
jgi:hypothetical protein